MARLDLNPHETTLLREILESDLSELGYEIANTDSLDYRNRSRERQNLLKRLVRSLAH